MYATTRYGVFKEVFIIHKALVLIVVLIQHGY